ncbi:hypothetical protein M0R45_017583 [Rubus argutus]|uniref:Uncharacterized protein n=1 Tax=Rubus argutus TaxID=59490 RepID=A0AAW1XVF7_RUBAR
MANLSSSLDEDYHGRASASVSVPFDWESQPGTPKSKFHQALTLPPLTPPPSYFYTTNSTKRPKRKSKYSKSLLLFNIFPKLQSRKASTPSSPASSSSSPSNSRSSSSSASSTAYYSVPSSPVSTPVTKHCARVRTMSNPRVQLEFDSGMLCPHEYGYGSSASTTSGCYSYLLKVLLREFRH